MKTIAKTEHISIDNLEIYQIAMEIGDIIWDNVSKWDAFAQQTLGAQAVRSADSIAGNIAEGYGRYFYKERRQFVFYSRGSLLEMKTWTTKALKRNLISKAEHDQLMDKLKILHLKLNIYLKKLKANLNNPTKTAQ